jgi:hypothetical protein
MSSLMSLSLSPRLLAPLFFFELNAFVDIILNKPVDSLKITRDSALQKATVAAKEFQGRASDLLMSFEILELDSDGKVDL